MPIDRDSARAFTRASAGLLRIVVGVAAVALLWRAVEGGQLADRLVAAEPAWIALAVVALNVQTILSAVRWRLTASRLGQRIGLRPAVREYYLGQLLNQVLPGGVAGDIGRAVRTRGGGRPGLVVSGQAVVIERVAGQLALIAVMLAAIVATSLAPGGLDWPDGTAAAILAAVAALALGTWRMTSRAAPRSILPRPFAGFAAAAGLALAGPEVRRRQLMLSLATVGCNVAAFAFCARATGTALAPGTAAALVPLVLLAMLIPLSVAGWGFREGAAAAVLPMAGVAPEAAIAASIAFGATLLAASLPGLLPLWPSPQRGCASAVPIPLQQSPGARPSDPV